MAEYAVSFAVETIGQLLIDEARFLSGVEASVKNLQKELKVILRMLKDADVRREHDQAVGEWVAELRDIAYDAEDVIERYIFRVVGKKEQNIMFACFVANCTCVQVHEVATEIEFLKSSISNLTSRMQGHGIQSVNEGERERIRALNSKQTYPHFEEDFVGREESIEKLVKELMKDGKRQRVISIWGMGGLGKTTLAMKVFTHDQVKKTFDAFGWACVSQVYHVKDILIGILVKLIPDQRERFMKMTEGEMFETLYKIQQEKRCIVVLDDIWTKEAWDSIRAAFPFENTRSRLLITSRNREIAEYIDPQGFFHEPQCLSEQGSWELLIMRAFPERKARFDSGLSSVGPVIGQGTAGGQTVENIATQSEMVGQIPVITKNMKRLGDELLGKCGGLPLAIIVLGGLLAVNEWETVYRNFSLHFNDRGDVLKVLALSYYDLPWHLKPCFLYLGSFPTDEEIPATKILHMWIAEGFVSLDAYDEENEVIEEDVAEQYLMELAKRGMVQVGFTSSGKIKTWRLHDLMRDLCVSKARQDGLVRILNIQQDYETEDSSSMAIEVESTCKTRRLSLNMLVRAKENMIARVKQIGRTMLHLRTLMFFNSEGSVKGMWEQFNHILMNCKFLRVLKLEYLSSMRGNLPESVGDLVLLRYLSLAGSVCEGLPQSMGNLVCMEFLDLHVRESCEVTVPNVLWKMRRLRHLHLPLTFSVHDLKKLRLDPLKNLRTLINFSQKNCDVNHIGRQTNLRKLTVRPQYGSDKLEVIPQLAKFTLKHLRTSSFRISSPSFTEGELSIMKSYCHPCKLSFSGEIEKLPEHKNLPQQLTKLVLIYSRLEEDPMPILGKLHHLVVLLLEDAFVGKEMVCSTGSFLQLKHLVLHDLRSLEEWRVAEGAMPRLSRLGISKCFKLKTLPEGVHTYDGFEDIADEYWKNYDMVGTYFANVSIAPHLIRELM